ncbi:MAG: hypothetical protein PVG99_12730, partial [Desulfobacteraceae bacterium]
MALLKRIFGKGKREKEIAPDEVKDVYTWLVADRPLRDGVYRDIFISAYRTMSQRNATLKGVIEGVGKKTIPNQASFGRASSENFASSFVDWLKTKGITVPDINSQMEKSIFLLSGDAMDPVARQKFNWAMFVFLRFK